MTETNDGWGKGGAFVLGGVLGGLAGYALRANNGFGNAGAYTLGAMTAGGVTGYGEGCDIARANARIDNIIQQNAQNEVINAIASVNANINTSAKDVLNFELQNLFAQQASDQNLNNQFCKVNESIVHDGMATRATINAFKDQYTQDRIADLSAENAQLKTQLSIAPLYATVNGISNTLNSVLCCPSVRCCCNNTTPVSGAVTF